MHKEISSTLSSNSHQLFQDAFIVREMILNAFFAAGGGHYGGTLSVVDILLVLYKKILNIPAHQKNNTHRDKLILSKGHAALGLYCVLANLGVLDAQKLSQYGKFQSGLEGHPDMLITPGIDFSSGSLGQGLSVGLGMAFAKRNLADVWVILGDGESQEGQVWEAALLAARYGIDNLFAMVDANGAQEYGYKYNSHLPQEPIPDMKEKWLSFGWHVQTVDGHSFTALEDACTEAKKTLGKPSLIIAQTRKGFGIPTFEKDPEYYHCITLTEEEHHTAIRELRKSYNN